MYYQLDLQRLPVAGGSLNPIISQLRFHRENFRNTEYTVLTHKGVRVKLHNFLYRAANFTSFKLLFVFLFHSSELNECASCPCVNGYQCQDLFNAFSCDCPVGMGPQCRGGKLHRLQITISAHLPRKFKEKYNQSINQSIVDLDGANPTVVAQSALL